MNQSSKKNTLKDLCNITKHSNICIIGMLEGEEGKKREGTVFEEIIAKNLLHLGGERYSGPSITDSLIQMIHNS